jgi:phospholipase/lecithinase/hemolysin
MKHVKSRLRISLGALIAGAALLATPAVTATAQSVYSFGDSLSDNGNLSALTLGLAPGGDYFQGRFSNGFIWTDYLSQGIAGELQRRDPGLIRPFIRRTTDGFNFAHGGSVSGSNGLTFDILLGGFNTALLQGIPAFRTTDQAREFRDQRFFFRRTFNAGPDDYATISAGGNDYLNGVTNVNFVVGNIVETLNILHDGGIRNTLILDLPSLGDIPGQFGSSDSARLNSLSSLHNTRLQSAADAFERNNRGTTVSVIPLGLLFDLIVNDADNRGGATFGFTTVRPGAGTSGSCLGDGLVLSACPDSFLFYDDIHPTASAQALIGQVALSVVRADVATASSASARTVTTDRLATFDNRLVTSRFAALRAGFTGSGVLTESSSTAGSFGGLGFQPLSGSPSGTTGTSVYSYRSGISAEFANRTPDADIFDVPDRGFSPGLQQQEFVESYGGDHLFENNIAIGGAYTRAELERDAFGIDSQDRSTAYIAYAAWFNGPVTLGLTSRNSEVQQSFQRASGLEFAPVAIGQGRSTSNAVRIDANYDVSLRGVALTAITRGAFSRLKHRGFQESGTLGLADRTVEDQSFAGYSGYAGIKAATRFTPLKGVNAYASMELGGLASSDRTIGFSSILDETALLGETRTDPGFSSTRFGASTLAGYGAFETGIHFNSAFSMNLRSSTLSTPEGLASLTRVSAVYTF